jgi:hypothetical protein
VLTGPCYDGLWFHLLPNVDSGTLTTLFAKFANAFSLISNLQQNFTNLDLVFVVVQKKCWLSLTIAFNYASAMLLPFSYKISHGLLTVLEANGWSLEDFHNESKSLYD